MEIEHALPVVALNGEYFGEDRLQSQVFTLGLRNLRLQKFPVRIGLQFDQVRRGDDFFDLPEVDTFCLGSRWHFDLFTMAGFHTGQLIFTKRHKARPPSFDDGANLPNCEATGWL